MPENNKSPAVCGSLSVTTGWAPIESAPKDGKHLVLWCASAERMIMEAAWSMTKGEWREWGIDGFGNMEWVRLEPYEIPTHWIRIVPPLPNPNRSTLSTSSARVAGNASTAKRDCQAKSRFMPNNSGQTDAENQPKKHTDK